jgi:hypothetical protein
MFGISRVTNYVTSGCDRITIDTTALKRNAEKITIAAVVLIAASHVPGAEGGPIAFAACMSICLAATWGAFAPACAAACAATLAAPTP